MSDQRDERFYVRGGSLFATYVAFREALAKMAAREGHQLDPEWYANDEETKREFDEIERRDREGLEGE